MWELNWFHVIANLFIVAIGFWFLSSCNKIQKAARGKKTDKPDYNAYLYKLARILEISEREVFEIAATEKNNLSWESHYDRFIDSGGDFLPRFLEDFLEEGREHIDQAKVKFWI